MQPIGSVFSTRSQGAGRTSNPQGWVLILLPHQGSVRPPRLCTCFRGCCAPSPEHSPRYGPCNQAGANSWALQGLLPLGLQSSGHGAAPASAEPRNQYPGQAPPLAGVLGVHAPSGLADPGGPRAKAPTPGCSCTSTIRCATFLEFPQTANGGSRLHARSWWLRARLAEYSCVCLSLGSHLASKAVYLELSRAKPFDRAPSPSRLREVSPGSPQVWKA